MEILGFILGGLVMLYLSFVCLAIPYVSALGGGLKGWETVGWLSFCAFVVFLWWIFLANSPFTIVAS